MRGSLYTFNGSANTELQCKATCGAVYTLSFASLLLCGEPAGFLRFVTIVSPVALCAWELGLDYGNDHVLFQRRAANVNGEFVLFPLLAVFLASGGCGWKLPCIYMFDLLVFSSVYFLLTFSGSLFLGLVSVCWSVSSLTDIPPLLVCLPVCLSACPLLCVSQSVSVTLASSLSPSAPLPPPLPSVCLSLSPTSSVCLFPSLHLSLCIY